ncbi:hypothetical protein [Actinacidiphila epipremni]|uniref:CHAT domain-containing protein n=1 Tax=Actinacidiphila epipremni TaxID=2053013 RepID=A0ABX0ZTF4_9ACTN|nr:hypothetical protein [Actinacidiphila epipremni]NJP45912.1 hypothetical protein [Actinacidiphila epipremni]
MALHLTSRVVLDHTDGMRQVAQHTYNRQRSIHLRFSRDPRGDGYEVQAWGSAFPEDGSGGYRGRTRHSAAEIANAVAVLRDTWQRHLVEHRHTGPDGRTVYPFVEDVDCSAAADCLHGAERIGLRLARAGHTLFTTLFGAEPSPGAGPGPGPAPDADFGDPGTAEIAGHLRAALRTAEHAVTVESDDLFVPWGLLYLPPGTDRELYGAAPAWSYDGFLGHRHVVEHGFSRTRGFDSRITVPRARVTVGLNVDERVDEEYPQTPYVERVIRFFTDRADVVVRRSKDELADALLARTLDEQITCFGCHAEVGGTGPGPGPYVVLGDDEEIYGADILAWLSGQPLPSRPLVFVGACQGGQLASVFYPSFGHHLLQHGARCLLGPQVDLPRAFAGAYTERLFEAFLEPGAKLGDVVRALARSFAAEQGNPLGLIFSLYRGMDVHLWPATDK